MGLMSLVGQRFGRLSPVSHKIVRGRTIWTCVCDCGKKKRVWGGDLRGGKIVSCGCYRKEHNTAIATIHGKHGVAEYEVWKGMKARCFNPNHAHYHRYGGRGIKVCDGWKDSFAAFISDMGSRPSAKHTIERINNDGDYSPDNCRWATMREQVINTSASKAITFRGETLSITEWAKRLHIARKTISKRRANGLPPEEILRK